MQYDRYLHINSHNYVICFIQLFDDSFFENQ